MNAKKHTVRTIQKMRDQGEIITMLTAYDHPTAKQINDAGIDMILVGDSCAMVVHGHPNTLNATMDMMVLHCAAVARGCDRTMVVADIPGLIEGAAQGAGLGREQGRHQGVEIHR